MKSGLINCSFGRRSLIEINDCPIQKPGMVTSFSKFDLPIIQCGEGFLEIRDWTTESGKKFKWNIGDQLI